MLLLTNKAAASCVLGHMYDDIEPKVTVHHNSRDYVVSLQLPSIVKLKSGAIVKPYIRVIQTNPHIEFNLDMYEHMSDSSCVLHENIYINLKNETPPKKEDCPVRSGHLFVTELKTLDNLSYSIGGEKLSESGNASCIVINSKAKPLKYNQPSAGEDAASGAP